VPEFKPIRVPKRVTLYCAGPERTQITAVYAHTTVLDILELIGLALDGTYQILNRDGVAYEMEDRPWADFVQGQTVTIERHPAAGPYAGRPAPGPIFAGGRRK
jgi:hypothetical protein